MRRGHQNEDGKVVWHVCPIGKIHRTADAVEIAAAVRVSALWYLLQKYGID